MKEVSVLGIAFDEQNDLAAVILSREGARKVVPIPIELNEGIQVIRLLQKKKMPRPMTHDLMMNIIGDLHHRVHKVEIDLGDSGQYTAVVLMSGDKDRQAEGNTITLDARPFDAIAIAIKCEAPMFMSENAYDTNSVPLVMDQKDKDKGKGKDKEAPNDEEFKDFLSGLKASDFNKLKEPGEPEDEPDDEE